MLGFLRNVLVSATALALGVIPSIAFSTEGGGDNIGQGSEGFYAGLLPSPGWYGVLYANYYHATRFNGGRGNSAIPGFELNADVLAARLFYMSRLHIAGGRVGVFAIGSVSSIGVTSHNEDEHRNGVGDVTVGPTIGWDFDRLHTLVAMDVSIPVGGFNPSRSVNQGANYFSIRPIFAFTYLPQNGLEVSAKLSYTFNTRNPATNYQSGQLFHIDYSVSLPVTKKLRIGVNGYYINQTTDDYQNDRRVGDDGFRGRVIALGPAAHYQFDKVGVDLKFLREFSVKNRSEGNSVWAKVVVPF
ncbi:transporter [Burkholderia anthina]|uniref:SphA family protein n=1 Tax=Burkholderia anthina TaxID=179879 RepID=UPI0009C02177|nr:transporter [Burkholderia anthina]